VHWGLLAALLVLSVLPRPVVWAALLILPLLGPGLVFALVAGQNPVPWSRGGLPPLTGTAAVVVTVTVAPRRGRLSVWRARPAPVAPLTPLVAPSPYVRSSHPGRAHSPGLGAVPSADSRAAAPRCMDTAAATIRQPGVETSGHTAGRALAERPARLPTLP